MRTASPSTPTRVTPQALRQLGGKSTLESWLKAHFARLNDGDYFALLAYIDADSGALRALQSLRATVRDRNARRDVPAIRSALSAFDRAGL